MADSTRHGWQAVIAFALALGIGSLAALTGCAQTTGGEATAVAAESAAPPQPWEWWRDLARVASLPDGVRTVMRSSHSPVGGKLDRHSEGDSRFLEEKDGEGVIFRADGAGAITRIWMVTGDRISRPLDPTIRIRVRIDGDENPAIDLPLPELFAGGVPPFVPPLVADRSLSGGGNTCYVPIPFRDGIEVSLVGAEEATLWFQITARLVDDAPQFRSFDMRQDLDDFAELLTRTGGDPWPGGPEPTISGVATLAPGGAEVVAELEGPDFVNGIILRARTEHWSRLGLRFTFDDEAPLLVPVTDLFGVPNTSGELTRSLLVGADKDRDLYCYFPMPFFERAKIELLRRPVEGPGKVRVEYALRTAGSPPPGDAGYFHVQVHRYVFDILEDGVDLIKLDGRGAWVGLVSDMAPRDGETWLFLEGDERIFVDGETEPSLHGTGVEDFFNGGFYFRTEDGESTPYLAPLAGASLIQREPPRAGMYRLLLGDAVGFSDGLRATLETGPTNQLEIYGRYIAYAYRGSERIEQPGAGGSEQSEGDER